MSRRRRRRRQSVKLPSRTLAFVFAPIGAVILVWLLGQAFQSLGLVVLQGRIGFLGAFRNALAIVTYYSVYYLAPTLWITGGVLIWRGVRDWGAWAAIPALLAAVFTLSLMIVVAIASGSVYIDAGAIGFFIFAPVFAAAYFAFGGWFMRFALSFLQKPLSDDYDGYDD